VPSLAVKFRGNIWVVQGSGSIPDDESFRRHIGASGESNSSEINVTNRTDKTKGCDEGHLKGRPASAGILHSCDRRDTLQSIVRTGDEPRGCDMTGVEQEKTGLGNYFIVS